MLRRSFLLSGFAVAAMAQDKSAPPPAIAARMRESVERFLATLSDSQRAAAMRGFDDADRYASTRGTSHRH
jgi:hypothetical protein